MEAQLSGPLTDIGAIRARHDALGWLLERRRLRAGLREGLKRTPDLERSLSRIGLGRGGPRDLAALRDGQPLDDGRLIRVMPSSAVHFIVKEKDAPNGKR